LTVTFWRSRSAAKSLSLIAVGIRVSYFSPLFSVPVAFPV
jgi:hypothetical protein